MPLPKVAIIGRPNVGKSSLFNALARRRISIEDKHAGITRDRVSAEVKVGARAVELTDTGGVGIIDADNLAADVERQIQIAMEEADVLVFVVDVRDGVAVLDKEVADRVRRLGKPAILVANKADTRELADLAGEFAALGLGEAIAASARGKIGLDEIRLRIDDELRGFPAEAPGPSGAQPLKLAIVGKRNSGKSTLVNYLAGEVRVIVSEVPGTTRDSVDVPFEYAGKRYVAIDTAGLRKKRSTRASVEFLSAHRTQRSIRRSDVTILLIDCTSRISEVDKKLASYVAKEYKPVVIAVNKYDLAEGVEPEKFERYIESQLPSLAFAPMVFMSAATGFNVKGLLELAQDLYVQATYRTTTGDLNRIVREIYQTRRPRAAGRKLPKVYYATQAGVAPPTIVLFVSNPKAFDSNYIRYVENSLRKALPLSEVPVKVVFRASGGDQRKSGRARRRP